ncbi:hypothetical protein [Nitrosomonas sp.]|nr:hypothetical protein [Nitrosomonas sp.]
MNERKMTSNLSNLENMTLPRWRGHAVFDLLILSFGDFHHHIISNSVNSK